ncbi:MAG: PTS sugar transporter subunit IIA [candidate division Zixibacteria bacterium]|nr:PTS sugar transporter subunit IIA [candidate division Zixibacteria bacterium]
MQISKYLDPNLIELELMTSFADLEEETSAELSARKLLERKEMILSELVGILEHSDKVCNRSKLLIDFVNREKKASTAIGNGIAVPHVRSMQARDFVIGICRSTAGYDFDSVDGKPVHIFIPMAAPPYDDNLYLKVFKELAEMFHYESFYERIMEAAMPYDIIRAVKEIE